MAVPDQVILQILYIPQAVSSSPLMEPEVLMQITQGSSCIPLIAKITISDHALMIPVQIEMFQEKVNLNIFYKQQLNKPRCG